MLEDDSIEQINKETDSKSTTTLMISMIGNKELYKPWTLISVSSSVEKWGSFGRLKSRHFEYLISFQNFYNC